MLFEILVGLIQAYIFSVLAAVYIGGAVGTMKK
jgi:F-type H+-transporting ATPase subunit a